MLEPLLQLCVNVPDVNDPEPKLATMWHHERQWDVGRYQMMPGRATIPGTKPLIRFVSEVGNDRNRSAFIARIFLLLDTKVVAMNMN